MYVYNCGDSKLVVGKQTTIRRSQQHSGDIVKTNLDLVQNPKDSIFNIS